MADNYSGLNGDQQQYVASGVGVKNLDGLGGGGSTRRGTVWSNTKPPSVENPVYCEAMYAEPHIMNESVVDAPPAAPRKESRMGILALVAALLAVTGIGVSALVISMGKSGGSDGIRSNSAPAATAAPLSADAGLAARVAALEGALAAAQEPRNHSDAIDALMARVAFLEAALDQSLARISILENRSSAAHTALDDSLVETRNDLNDGISRLSLFEQTLAVIHESVNVSNIRISDLETDAVNTARTAALCETRIVALNHSFTALHTEVEDFTTGIIANLGEINASSQMQEMTASSICGSLLVQSESDLSHLSEGVRQCFSMDAVSIRDTVDITSLRDVFHNLVYVGNLRITGNVGLTTLSNAFKNVRQIGNLWIGDNRHLTTMSGAFRSLTKVRTWFQILGNDVLQDINGSFYNLSTAASEGGNFQLSDNIALESFGDAFASLTTIGGPSIANLQIRGNSALNFLGTSFQNLQHVSSLGFSANGDDFCAQVRELLCSVADGFVDYGQSDDADNCC